MQKRPAVRYWLEAGIFASNIVCEEYMAALLLLVIYLIFISLGLPDSLLESGWPRMQVDLGVSSSYAGYVSMTISLPELTYRRCRGYMKKMRNPQKNQQAG